MRATLARRRVPIGFASAALAYWLARPTVSSLMWGAAVALVGEAVRLWASGHIEKGREVTRSGPYRFMRHPLYVGSAIMGAGFALAALTIGSAVVVAAYLTVTLFAAIRTEEAVLDARFGPEYAAYREGRALRADRPFSARRALVTNREHRALGGLLAGLALLWVRMQFGS